MTERNKPEKPTTPKFPWQTSDDDLTRREKKWRDIIEEQVSEAQERGDFDNLKGKGKPLDIRGNPYAGDWEMAYTALANAGYAPDWIERDKEIRTLIEEARRMLDRHVAWYHEVVAGLDTLPARKQAEQRNLLDTATDNMIQRYQAKAAIINTKIINFNLICPVPSKQRFKVRIEDDVRDFRARLTTASQE